MAADSGCPYDTVCIRTTIFKIGVKPDPAQINYSIIESRICMMTLTFLAQAMASSDQEIAIGILESNMSAQPALPFEKCPKPAMET